MMERTFPSMRAARRWVMLYTLGDGLPHLSTDLSWQCGITHRELYDTIGMLEAEGLVRVDRTHRPMAVEIVFPPLVTVEPSHA
jgi:hypothetical protein